MVFRYSFFQLSFLHPLFMSWGKYFWGKYFFGFQISFISVFISCHYPLFMLWGKYMWGKYFLLIIYPMFTHMFMFIFHRRVPGRGCESWHILGDRLLASAPPRGPHTLGEWEECYGKYSHVIKGGVFFNFYSVIFHLLLLVY